MVFELKKTTKKSKGILVFSHKEYINLFNKTISKRILEEINKHYLIGIHWGISKDNIVESKYVDFHLSLPGVLPTNFENENPIDPIVEKASRSFIPSNIFFENKDIEKKYDVINVGRKVKMKRNLDLFLIINELLKKNNKLKVLLIITDANVRKWTYDWLFEENFNKVIEKRYRKNIEIISFKSLEEKPSHEFIARKLNESKTFLFTSRREGVAKVTAEAALCNIPIIMYKNFRGAASYGLEEEKVKYYNSISEAVDSINSFLEFKRLPARNIENDVLNDKQNIVRLEEEIKSIFNKYNEYWEGAIDTRDLSERINSYRKELSDNLVDVNNDIRDSRALYNFSINNLNMDVYVSRLSLAVYWLKEKCLGLKSLHLKLIPVPIIKTIRRKRQWKDILSF